MAVRSLLHYALEVPDQQVGQQFYLDFGFQDATGAANAVKLRPKALEREQILLYEGPKKRLHHLAFAAPGEDFEAVRARLRAAGIPEIDPPQDAPEGGIWVRDPDGHRVNIRDERPVTPPPDPPLPYNSPGRPVRVAARAVEPPVEAGAAPRKLGHVLLFTPDIERQKRFYLDILGMKLSDQVPGVVAFLRCTTDHHNLAFAQSDRPGFHHGSFEVGSIDEIMFGVERMRERGWQPGWGLGRHCIGSNIFYYLRDPWGSYAEYYFDIDYIPEDAAWQPRDWDVRYALYVWGPAPPPDFLDNKEDY
ncbi:MAG TPA: VOC family protein [Chloroflexota bacterium]|nr:VOC family protein [Chloroflexota bacterium]